MIVTLDDYGLNSKVNHHIDFYTKMHKVDFVSLLTNTPYKNEAIRLYKSNKKIHGKLGLHFNLIEGKPLSKPYQVVSLVNKKGVFYSLPEFIIRLFFGLIKRDHIMKELQKQFSVFSKNNIICAHINSHQNIHVFHFIYDCIEEFAKKNNIKYIRQVPTVQNRLKKFPIKLAAFIILYFISANLFKSFKQKPDSFFEETLHPGTTYDA